MSGVMTEQRRGEALTIEDEDVIDALVDEWKFFRPTVNLVKQILQLREELGDSYLKKEYESLKAQTAGAESNEDVEITSVLVEQAEKKSSLRLIFSQMSSILGLGGQRGSNHSDEESVALQQNLISEKIYNHLAMLARSPRTIRGEAFSIRKELTQGIAEKIGLGLYLSSETDDELRQETEKVLLRLADEYQKWFLDNRRRGAFEATWGNIYESHKEISKKERDSHPLILTADLANAAAATKT